jgi:lactate dehydrogenase-like 2-hydroxyacid dehydrogenase
MAGRPAILKAAKLPEKSIAELEAVFEVLTLPEDHLEAAQMLRTAADRIRGIAVRKTIIDKTLIDSLPALEIIANYSAGLENVDVAHARAKDIAVTNTSHILAGEVANLVVGQAIALTRDLLNADRFVRAGKWKRQPYELTRSLAGMHVGIVGFGHIGSAAATRFETLGARVSYTGPARKPVANRFYETVRALAEEVEMLVVTCPLTQQTRGLIDAGILSALGSAAYLINVSRGPIVDEAALIACLAENGIAGTALDVFADEPNVPDALLADHRVILTPHIGSGTIETRQRMADAMVASLVERLMR